MANKKLKEYAIALLTPAAGVTVNTNVGTKQDLYTVPTGKKCSPLYIVLDEVSASLAAIGDAMIFGFDGGASDWGTITGAALATFTGGGLADLTMNQSNPVGLTATPSVKGAAGDVFGCIFNDPSITATMRVRVFGILEDE